ncbi:tetratricopeptide repeat protein [uncultured Shewanella sp.]|uniref:tetratricopeptide repeat protein n=1 Tax=Shewanella atlantica TaxID=271099 RepID=UPI00263427F3|nr:tetratricopeptide repeat protein [uncultured Shewanella sp.]
MNKIISGIIFIAVNLLAITTTAANQLEPCATAECQEYFKAYKILTKRGHSEAMATLAELYYAGYGTTKDNEQALKWFRRSAKFGIVSAQYKAGVLYLQNSDFQDIDRGVSLLKRATKADFSPASLVLGKLYLGGHLVERDYEEADIWLSQAYQLNNPEILSIIDELKGTSELSNLPALSALTKSEHNQLAPAFSSPTGEMETIVVTAPDYTAYFDDEIARLNSSIPDTSSGTGSKIRGKTCAVLWGCSTETDPERIRDFLLSDWGNAAIQFR